MDIEDEAYMRELAEETRREEIEARNCEWWA